MCWVFQMFKFTLVKKRVCSKIVFYVLCLCTIYCEGLNKANKSGHAEQQNRTID